MYSSFIEIAGQMLDPLGNQYGDAFESLVNPFMKLTSFITNLTGITTRDLYGKPGFVDVITDFFKFIKTKIRQYEEERSAERGEAFSIERIVFVAHNGTSFEIPFLFHKIKKSGLDVLNNIISKMFLLDTCTLARAIIKKRGMTEPANYKLGTLFPYVTSEYFGDGHHALYDVNHTLPVLKHGIFWYRKDNYIFKINPDGSIDSNKTIYDDLNDSDTDDSDDENEEVLEREDEDGILEDLSQP
jgi:DNA polymerase III alpha subunit (gram-positive type)